MFTEMLTTDANAWFPGPMSCKNLTGERFHFQNAADTIEGSPNCCKGHWKRRGPGEYLLDASGRMQTTSPMRMRPRTFLSSDSSFMISLHVSSWEGLGHLTRTHRLQGAIEKLNRVQQVAANKFTHGVRDCLGGPFPPPFQLLQKPVIATFVLFTSSFQQHGRATWVCGRLVHLGCQTSTFQPLPPNQDKEVAPHEVPAAHGREQDASGSSLLFHVPLYAVHVQLNWGQIMPNLLEDNFGSKGKRSLTRRTCCR